MDSRPRVLDNRARTLAMLAVGLVVLVGARAWSWRTLEERGLVEVAPFSFDLNLATTEELDLIPGVGEKLASDIIALREELGGFQSVEQLAKVRGIKDAKIKAISQYVFVAGEDLKP
ncbi:ComEA family DNA-binding protein [Pirellulaceae bacterium SH449]